MKKKLLIVSLLTLLTTGITLSTDKTVSASSARLSDLRIKNILDDYDRQINWDVSTYNSIYRYWRIQIWYHNQTASDMREALDKVLAENDR